MQRIACVTALAGVLAAGVVEDGRKARDAQDRATLEAAAARALAAAGRQAQNARAQYEAALVHSYVAEVAIEIRDHTASRKAAETGIAAAEKAVSLDPKSAEYHRILGALYGQVIPGNVAMAMKYGRRTLEELDRAIALDPKSSDAYLSRGIGKYYVPGIFGGGTDAALEDIRKAIELNPKSDQAYLWMGIALRKAGRNVEARDAITKALKLNPQRVWAKQQLDKTPAQ